MRVGSRYKISTEGIKKILVRSTNWVGDTVMMTPSLVTIKRYFPRAKITTLATPWVLPLLDSHPAVDSTMVLDKGKGLISSLKELARIINWLRGEEFDLAILFQNAFELMEAMGWPVEEREPILYINDEDIKSSSLMLSSMGVGDNLFIVGLNPGAEYGSAKRWPEDRFAIIGDWAARRWGAKVLLFGSSQSVRTDYIRSGHGIDQEM